MAVPFPTRAAVGIRRRMSERMLVWTGNMLVVGGGLDVLLFDMVMRIDVDCWR